MKHRPVIVLDGDDTLWWAEPLYDEARREASELVAEAQLDPVAWTALQRETDLRKVLTMGLSADRFPRSCVEAYERLAASVGREVDSDLASRIREAAAGVFTKKALVHPAAESVLRTLRKDFALGLLTKGDAGVQQRRIADSGLRRHLDSVTVVDQKTSDQFREVVAGLDGGLTTSWSVGNSLVSDIEPALHAGLRAVWIDAHVWDHERKATIPHPGVIVLDDLSELPAALAGTPADVERA